MPLVEQMYCTQQINVPPKLPKILKQFCKAAIRTQPYDLLKWSSTYFRALANGEEPPMKARLEYPPPSTASGLTPGFLKVLLRQFGDYNKKISMKTIERRWDGLCLGRKDLDLITMVGKFRHECQVKKFLAIAVSLLTNSLQETMITVCELFTHELDGGSAMIPVTLFMEIYGYLAGLQCGDTVSEEDQSDSATLNDSDRIRSSISSRTANDFSCSSNVAAADSTHIVASPNTEAEVHEEMQLSPRDGNQSRKGSSSTAEVAEEDIREDMMSEKNIDLSQEADVNSENKNTSIKSEGKDYSDVSYTDGVPKKNIDSLHSGEEDTPLDVQMMKSDVQKMKTTTDALIIGEIPNISGIGPRLSAEQVANVAIWMSECAKLQEGLVGPRNIRHYQCPSLDVQVSQP